MKLPSLKLPFGSKRRKSGDDDDEAFDLDEDEFEDEEEEEDDGAYDDDDDEEEGSAWERMDPQRKVLIIAGLAAGLLLTSIFGGAAWFLFGGEPEKAAEQAPQHRADGSIAIPAAPVPGQGQGLTPPPPGGEAPQAAGQPAPTGQPGAAAPTAPIEPVVGGISASQVGVQNEGLGGLAAQTTAVGQDPERSRVVPFATGEAFRGIAPFKEVDALARVPDLALVEKGPDGRDMPIVARNGTRPMDAYARPVADADAAIPQVAIIIRGIGLSRTASITAIKSLPPEVSMVISPYARDPSDWVLRARLAGHEVFMGLPMESANFPFEDAGPLALNSAVQLNQNMATLHNIMAMVPGYVGFMSRFGSRFGVAEGQLKPIFEEIKARGLMFIDSGESGSGAMSRIAGEVALPMAVVNIHLDRTPTEDEIASRLLRLGALARSQSIAVAMGEPYPHTIRELKSWLAAQPPDKLRLVPVSAVADRQIIQ